MNAWLKHPLRVTGRLFWLAGELLLAALTYGVHCGLKRNRSLAVARGAWLQYSSRRVLRIFRLQIQVAGEVPRAGLLVSNHLSYVDILLLSALTPAVFVAKYEVESWPVFGWFARLAGTVFVNRERRAQTVEASQNIETVLGNDVVVVLFPEGTSSDGKTVLPFKSSLLEPAMKRSPAMTTAAIRYELDDGDPGEEVCYWKDMVLVPHLITLLSKHSVRATVRFAPFSFHCRDRKELARKLHAAVVGLKTRMD